ncbi:penicillin-binding protein 2 [Candidatus Berkelbacteria bacterium RIFOXYA2_FULL_43_10]|uniref:Penicillin-binding protein 2 n=1 Tax=Candidatus Berkelbacteria bacterium RIFOXYA2_FULL_43_10 TaxID=1797472 RepID=A0A1F5E5G1_9BACT|nr:MAG: penicillin-binding protein 2 [Candidatus Berkelbacteria bacterium RIFOXYA2_FULL_43_10]
MDIFGNFSKLVGDKGERKVGETSDFEYSLDSEGEEEKIGIDEGLKRVNLLWMRISLVAIFLIILIKIFLSQVVYGQISEELAKGNKIRPRVITALRGTITDKNGVWLTRNIPSFDLAVYPSDLPKDSLSREEEYQQISDLIESDFNVIKNQVEANGLLSLDQVVIKENLSREEALILEEQTATLPGVFVAQRASREYKTLSGLAHILGYTGKVSESDLDNNPDYLLSDWIGKSGLEASYEKHLKGKNGIEQVEVDSQGSIIRVLVDENNREPVEGESISLYLDSGLQEKVGEYLTQGMEEAKKLTGEESGGAVAIVMNVKNGGILSMVSLPSYDNNLFAKGISATEYQNLINDPKKPMFSRATSGAYPPGSIIKIIMASAGLAEGVISVHTSLDTPPSIEVGEWSFPDWKDHGMTNVERAIAESNNIFFYALGGGYDKIKGIGINNMKKWWQKFGLGSRTGIDLATEASGLLPDPGWKEKVFGEPWYIGDTYHAAIGQGDLLITPLQMVRAVATIANGGKLLEPKLVQKISDKEGNIVEEYGATVQNEQVASPEVISTVQRGMRMAVTEGSARTLNDLPFKVAGKTGTAQFFGNQKTHAWFEAFAPYDDPEIAVIVLVEGGGGGYEIAVPVARNILEYYFANK